MNSIVIVWIQSDDLWKIPFSELRQSAEGEVVVPDVPGDGGGGGDGSSGHSSDDDRGPAGRKCVAAVVQTTYAYLVPANSNQNCTSISLQRK